MPKKNWQAAPNYARLKKWAGDNEAASTTLCPKGPDLRNNDALSALSTANAETDLIKLNTSNAVELPNGVTVPATKGITATGACTIGSSTAVPLFGGTVRIAANQTFDNTSTLGNVTGLVVTVVPGTYLFRVQLPLTACTTSGGIKIAFKYTTAVVSALQSTVKAFAAAAVAVSNFTTATDQAVHFDSKAAVVLQLVSEGSMVVGTGGTVQLQAAQNTGATGGDVTTIAAGAFMTFTRIA